MPDTLLNLYADLLGSKYGSTPQSSSFCQFPSLRAFSQGTQGLRSGVRPFRQQPYRPRSGRVPFCPLLAGFCRKQLLCALSHQPADRANTLHPLNPPTTDESRKQRRQPEFGLRSEVRSTQLDDRDQLSAPGCGNTENQAFGIGSVGSVSLIGHGKTPYPSSAFETIGSVIVVLIIPWLEVRVLQGPPLP